MLFPETPGNAPTSGLLDLLIRAALIAVLAYACYRVFRPFLDLALWALILSITLYPLQLRLEPRFGNKAGLTAAVIVISGLALLLVPIYLLGMSLNESAGRAIAVLRSGEFHIPPPSEAVAAWPLIGARLHDLWSQAATDLSSLAQTFAPQIRPLAVALLGKLASAGIGLLVFFAALAIAGVFMAFARTGHRSALAVASRLFGSRKAVEITGLCVGTVRAVAQGVVGIAFIQMLLIGVALVLMDIPGAALFALLILLLGIMQLPATLVTVPVIVYVFATTGVDPVTVAFAVYVFLAGLIDNVLKPLLLGRGVDVPMPVVLVGALGGMVSSGIIGLFIGPVLLAVAYVLFWQWVEGWPLDAPATAARPGPSPP